MRISKIKITISVFVNHTTITPQNNTIPHWSFYNEAKDLVIIPSFPHFEYFVFWILNIMQATANECYHKVM